jgi:hypothetical protein
MAKSKGGSSPKRCLATTSSKHILDVPHEHANVDDPKLQNKLSKRASWFLQMIKTQVPMLVV